MLSTVTIQDELIFTRKLETEDILPFCFVRFHCSDILIPIRCGITCGMQLTRSI